MWDVVSVLKGCDIHVQAFVFDGASPNRKIFRIHKTPLNYNVSADGVIYWTLNRFNEGARIYFICDAPNLIKTVQNNIENFHGHKITRNLVVSDVWFFSV